jgi:hypothetical protein
VPAREALRRALHPWWNGRHQTPAHTDSYVTHKLRSSLVAARGSTETHLGLGLADVGQPGREGRTTLKYQPHIDSDITHKLRTSLVGGTRLCCVEFTENSPQIIR